MKKLLKLKVILMAAAVLAFIAISAVLLLGADGSKQGGTGQSRSSDGGKNKPEPSFNKQLHSIDDPASLWVVVNKKRPLNPKNYMPGDLITLGNGTSLRREAADSLNALLAAAKSAGFTIFSQSAYRSYASQLGVYSNEVKNFGQKTADTQSARAGHSEHQTGWAIDLATAGCVEDCFGKTPAAVWVRDNAAAFGFIMRYPPGRDDVTGYRHEPWHFRYVGKELGTEIARTGQTLEEFFNLPNAKDY